MTNFKELFESKPWGVDALTSMTYDYHVGRIDDGKKYNKVSKS